MNKREARQILAEQVARLRKQSYAELRRYQSKERFRLGPISFATGENVESIDVTGESGAEYVVNIESFWDRKPNGAIRVLVEIHDVESGRTLTDNFIVAPDGSFVGE